MTPVRLKKNQSGLPFRDPVFMGFRIVMNSVLKKRIRRGVWGMLAMLGLVAGCRSVPEHRAAVDRRAEALLAGAQQAALGVAEPLEIESPADTLRRRLMLDQGLAHGGPASLGVADLPDTVYWQQSRHRSAEEAPATGEGAADALILDMLNALQVAARNSREYQQAKESLFREALRLDLERDAFRSAFSAGLSGQLEHDRSETGAFRVGDGEEGAPEAGESVTRLSGSSSVGVTRRFRNGTELSGRIAVDLVKLLTQDATTSLGLLADASISIPLLRGSGRLVAGEPLEQAERNLVYEVYAFERFKRAFAVRIAREYLGVLQEQQQVVNVEENYRRLIASTRRARRLADAGLLPEFQHDQAVQDELRARTRWIEAVERHATRLETFRVSIGLPPDAAVSLDTAELQRLHLAYGDSSDAQDAMADPRDDASGAPVFNPPVNADTEPLSSSDPDAAGPLEMPPEIAIPLALERRLDLRVAGERVADAQRRVFVAADALRAELTLLGRAQMRGRRISGGDAGSDTVNPSPDRGIYLGALNLDLPFKRTREQAAYRQSLLDLESAVRGVQALEDQIKLEIRGQLRDLQVAREGVRIQRQAVALAEKRVHSTDLFLQAGRAQIRDLLESQEALLNARNGLTSAIVNYRNAELALQRDLEVLTVNRDGLWEEFTPEERTP